MRVMITGGGTGGHVYPALAVAEVLEDSQLLYVGTSGGLEEGIVARWGVPFEAVSSAPVRGMNPIKLGVNLYRLAQGVREARELIKRFAPEVILATGGYVSVPVVVAGRLEGVPSLVYLPDIEPGWAVRFLAFFASRVAVTFPEALGYFPSRKGVVTGYPVRRELLEARREKAIRAFGLEENLKTVLVFGGSRGARSINRALAKALPELLEVCQVLHISGQLDYEEMEAIRSHLPEGKRSRYHLFPYLHREMGLALAVADLVVARAGAATLGEFPALGKPSVLVPYPYAGQHQERNARYLEGHKAAVVIKDAELGAKLLSTVLELLRDDHRLNEMKENALKLARPRAAYAIARELTSLARGTR